MISFYLCDMRICKVSILLFLIIKASLGLGMMPSLAVESCCSHETEKIEILEATEDIQDEQEEKNCCDGPACHCFCCHAVFIGEDFAEFQLNDDSKVRSLNIFSSSNYHHLATNAIWQPPRV